MQISAVVPKKISKSELCIGTAPAAVMANEREASQNYAQALSQNYCIRCVLEVKAQVPSSAMASKER